MKRRPTRGDVVLAAVRSDILNGVLDPGTQLGFADMGQRYNASVGVLREVLPRLVEQGLATAQPQLGYRVMDVSVSDLEHLTEARVVIETMVLEQSIHGGDLDWESTVVAVHHRLTQLPTFLADGRINADWLDTHRRFHEVILEGCPSPRLREVAQRLRDVSEVYRCWSVRSMHEVASRDEEHARIAALTVQRDVVGACAALRQHIEKTTELLLATQRSQLVAHEAEPA